MFKCGAVCLTLYSTTTGFSSTDLAQFLKDSLLGVDPCLSQARAAASLGRPPFTMEKDFSDAWMYEPAAEMKSSQKGFFEMPN